MEKNFSKTAQRYGAIMEFALQKVRYSLRGRFSHANEQNILAKYIEQLGLQNGPRTVVDIGAGNGVRWSNSYALLLAGWKVLSIEADPGKYELLAKEYSRFPKADTSNLLADPYNIGRLLKDFDLQKNFGVLCLDIDGNDFWLLEAVLSNFRPSIVITEINENIPPPLRFVVKFDPDFRLRKHFYGYSIAALEDLCDRHGYGILELEYNNAFLAPRELGPAQFRGATSAYREGYLDRPERKERFASNLDMEALHSLGPEAGIYFLHEFYAREAGNYYLTADKDSLADLIEPSTSSGAVDKPQTN